MMTIFLSESMCKNYVQTLCLQVMTFQREKLGRKNFSEKGMKSVVGDGALVGLLARAQNSRALMDVSASGFPGQQHFFTIFIQNFLS